jgi:hypothetical protein
MKEKDWVNWQHFDLLQGVMQFIAMRIQNGHHDTKATPTKSSNNTHTPHHPCTKRRCLT